MSLTTTSSSPHVGQVFLIERAVIHKKSGRQSIEVALGVTSRTAAQASPAQLLRINRGHWAIEHKARILKGIDEFNYSPRKRGEGI